MGAHGIPMGSPWGPKGSHGSPLGPPWDPHGDPRRPPRGVHEAPQAPQEPPRRPLRSHKSLPEATRRKNPSFYLVKNHAEFCGRATSLDFPLFPLPSPKFAKCRLGCPLGQPALRKFRGGKREERKVQVKRRVAPNGKGQVEIKNRNFAQNLPFFRPKNKCLLTREFQALYRVWG